MKKTLALIPAVFFGLASGVQGSVHLTLYGGYASTPDKAAGEAAVVGGSVGFSLSPTLSLDLTVGRWVVPTHETENGLSPGRLAETPIALELRARFPFSRNRFGVYVAGGLGYALHNFELDGGFADGWRSAGLEISERADHGFAGQIGAGLEIALGPAFALDIGAKYTILRTKGTWTIADLATGENAGGPMNNLNFDALAIVAGFRVVFR